MPYSEPTVVNVPCNAPNSIAHTTGYINFPPYTNSTPQNMTIAGAQETTAADCANLSQSVSSGLTLENFNNSTQERSEFDCPIDGRTEPILPSLDPPNNTTFIPTYPGTSSSLNHNTQAGVTIPNQLILPDEVPPLINLNNISTISHGAKQKSNVQRHSGAIKPSVKNKTTKKQLPATSQKNFDEESKTRQVNIALAKIQELEAENIKLKKSNEILGERIKLLENSRDKTFENNLRSNDSRSSQQPHPHRQVCPLMITCACHMTEDTHVWSQSDRRTVDTEIVDLKDTMNGILMKVNELSTSVIQFGNDLTGINRSFYQSDLPSTHSQNAAFSCPDPASTPTYPNAYNDAHENNLLVDNNCDNADMSDTSIDQYVPLEQVIGQSLCLNSEVPTNQV